MLPSSKSDLAGLKERDEILFINNIKIDDLTLDEANDLIQTSNRLNLVVSSSNSNTNADNSSSLVSSNSSSYLNSNSSRNNSENSSNASSSIKNHLISGTNTSNLNCINNKYYFSQESGYLIKILFFYYF